MKNIFRSLFVVLSAFIGTSLLSAQWVQTAGPEGAGVETFAVSGTNLFAAVLWSGIFRSTDNGTSWSQVNSGLSRTNVTTLAVSGTNLFAGIYGGGVFLSTNNGTSWKPVNTGLTDYSVNVLAVSGPNLFVGTYYGGVFISTNEGENWSPVNTGLTFLDVRTIAVAGTNLFAGTAWGVYLSTNNGTNWTVANTGLPGGGADFIAVSGMNLYATEYEVGVFRSTDNGTSWNPVNSGLTDRFVKGIAVSGTNLFVGTDYGGVFISTNEGENWSPVNTGLTVYSAQAFAVSGTNLFASTGGGVFLSTNNGTSWSAAKIHLIHTDISFLVSSGTNLFAGTYRSGVFLSTNNGANWTQTYVGLENQYVKALAISGKSFFAGTDGGGVFLSTNNGTSWRPVNTGLTNTYVVALGVSGTNLFVGTGGGVFLSTDEGMNWSPVNTGLKSAYVVDFAVSGTNLFAGTNYGVFLSTNNGTSWTAAGLSDYEIEALVVSGNMLFAGTGGPNDRGVFRSTDNGTSWSQVNAGLTNTYVGALAISGTNLFAGTAGGVFFSSNSGTNWSTYNLGLTANRVGSLTLSGMNLFAGTLGGFFDGTTGSGVWYRPLDETIPTTTTIYPQVTLSAGSINAGQSITISGHNFEPNGTANIVISGDNIVSKNIDNITINSQGVISYSLSTDIKSPAGLYSVQITDNVTGLVAQKNSFRVKSNAIPISYLNILSPRGTFTVTANQSFLVEWKDKMITGGNYTLTRSQRNYKYKIEWSSDNGASWELLGTMEGKEVIGNWVNLHYYPSIATPGINHKIRITDFYDNNNSQSTPAFTVSSNTYTGNLKVDLNWDRSYTPQPSVPVEGIAADGTARIFLNLSKIDNIKGPKISSVSVSLGDAFNGNAPSKLGKVMVATHTASYSLEANNIQSVQDVDNIPNKANYLFWYVAPDDFAGADPEDVNNSFRIVSANFTVYYDNGLTEQFTRKIDIVRPPLALVHGLGSSPSAWDKFAFTSPNGLPIQYVSSYNYLFHQVSAIPIMPDAHFSYNAFSLIVPSSSQPISNTLQGVIKDMRERGYAANQVDYVAHSMGGNVIRQVANLYPNAFNVTGNFSNSPYKNYEKGFVHKIITLNTPHNGSPWGDLVSQTTPYLEWVVRHPLSDLYNLFPAELSSFFHPIGNYNYLTLSYDRFVASDAVQDLEVSDPGINMDNTNIPSHLIAGDVFGNSSSIDPFVWNTTDHMPYFTKLMNIYWQVMRATETDPSKKAQLNTFAGINSNAERAVRFLDYYVSAYMGTPNFILDGDFIVPLNSQTAGLEPTATNVSVYSGLYSNHTKITEDLEVGDRVLQLINSPVDGPLFKNIPPSKITHNEILSHTRMAQLGTLVVSEIDPNKIKILIPASMSHYTTDSILVVEMQISDTVGLKYVVLNVQGEMYLTTSFNPFLKFKVPLNAEVLGNQQIVATAAYDVLDSTIFAFDTLSVDISIDQPVQGLTTGSKTYVVLKGQTVFPEYYATYSTLVAKVGNNNSKMTATVNNPNIVSQDLHSLGFTGKNEGETFSVIEYGGTKDTLYFIVSGDNVSSVFGEKTHVSVENIDAHPGDTVKVPLRISIPQGRLCNSAELHFSGYQHNGLTFLDLDTTSTMLGSAGWQLQINNTDSLLLTAAAGAQPIAGTGVLVSLNFLVTGRIGSFVPITIAKVVFDTGFDSVTATNGGVNIIAGLSYGDVDQNGKVQAYDASMVLKSVAGIDTLRGQALANADVTNDGTVSAADARSILRYVTGLIGSFPDTTISTLNGGAAITVLPLKAHAGEIISIPVILKDVHNLVSFEGDIKFDPAILDFQGIDSSNLLDSFMQSRKNDVVQIAGYSNERLNSAGTIVTLRFKTVKSNGNTQILFTKLRYNENTRLRDVVIADVATGVMSLDSDIPAQYALDQNYPNPFNPVSTIRYALPTESYVRLTISNVLGVEIRTLVSANQQSGHKSIQFDGVGFPSGIYFYHLDATAVSDPNKHFNQTRKMVLLK